MTAAEASPKAPSGSDDGAEVPPMSLQFKKSLAAMLLMAFVSNVGGLVFTPTLIFYLRQVGGSETQYGQILAAAPFASFFAMPLYGSWIDHSGNQYRKAWFFGYGMMISGMVLYTFAIVFGESQLTVYTILFSRVVHGLGSASKAIDMTWFTEVADLRHLTLVQLLFTAVGTAGSICAPAMNALIANLDVELNVFRLIIPINANNGAGLLIAAIDTISLVFTYFFIPDPPAKKNNENADALRLDSSQADLQEEKGWATVLKELTSFKLFLPMFAGFVITANIMIIDSAFSPAVAHGLGWGPVEVSAAMAFISIVYTIMLAAVWGLTKIFADTTMVVLGFLVWFGAGLMMYAWWIYGAPAWKYVAPLALGIAATPLIGPSNFTIFTSAIMAKSELEPCKARLQSAFAMVGAFASFLTPIFVGAYVLRSPKEIESGTNPHELTNFSLYIAVFSGVCVVGFLYEKWVLHVDGDKVEDIRESVVSERSSLLQDKPEKRRSSIIAIKRELSGRHRSSLASSNLGTTNMGGCRGGIAFMPFESEEEKQLEELLRELEAEEGA